MEKQKIRLLKNFTAAQVLAVVVFAAAGLLISMSPLRALAAGGGIDTSHKYAWGENLGWVNMSPTNGNVVVTSSGVTGYAWSSVDGWINFGPFTNAAGVTNNGNGQLGGDAWVAGAGWLPMSGVSVASDGTFSGVAGTAGSLAGRVNFNCSNCSVITAWRPASEVVAPKSSPKRALPAQAIAAVPPPAVAPTRAQPTLFDISAQPKAETSVNNWRLIVISAGALLFVSAASWLWLAINKRRRHRAAFSGNLVVRL